MLTGPLLLLGLVKRLPVEASPAEYPLQPCACLLVVKLETKHGSGEELCDGSSVIHAPWSVTRHSEDYGRGRDHSPACQGHNLQHGMYVLLHKEQEIHTAALVAPCFCCLGTVQRFGKGERFLYWPDLSAVLHAVEHIAKEIYLNDGDPFILFSSCSSVAMKETNNKEILPLFFFLPFHTEFSCKILG